MPNDDILELLSKKPFEPFRIHLADGTVYEIRHPELIMVGKRSAIIGLKASEGTRPVYDRYETISLLHVTRLEPIPSAAQTASV